MIQISTQAGVVPELGLQRVDRCERAGVREDASHIKRNTSSLFSKPFRDSTRFWCSESSSANCCASATICERKPSNVRRANTSKLGGRTCLLDLFVSKTIGVALNRHGRSLPCSLVRRRDLHDPGAAHDVSYVGPRRKGVVDQAYPEASISNVTSIWGVPRGAGGIPVSSNEPRWLLSLVMPRSPS